MMVQFTSEENFITARNLSENAVYLCTVYALNSVGSVSTDDALRICKLEKIVWGVSVYLIKARVTSKSAKNTTKYFEA